MPSVRQLARELAVNQNTILHVYERLTAEGLLERRQGDGTYLAQRLPSGRAAAQRELLLSEIDRLCHRAADLGIGLEEMQKLLAESFDRIGKERGVERLGATAVVEMGAETRPDAKPELGVEAVEKTVEKTVEKKGEERGAHKREDQWRNW